MTKEQINKAIKECFWLSQNRSKTFMQDICTGECLPCARVIECGKCDTLRELFKAESEKDCTDCILDGTDACTRGSGRAVDATICKDFMEDKR